MEEPLLVGYEPFSRRGFPLFPRGWNDAKLLLQLFIKTMDQKIDEGP